MIIEMNTILKRNTSDEELLEQIQLKEDLHSKTIQDMMADGLSEPVATAIYEAEHGIDMEEVTLEQLLWEIHNI